jgi:hypothetical protein
MITRWNLAGVTSHIWMHIPCCVSRIPMLSDWRGRRFRGEAIHTSDVHDGECDGEYLLGDNAVRHGNYHGVGLSTGKQERTSDTTTNPARN